MIQTIATIAIIALVIYRNSRPQVMNEVRFWIPVALVVFLTAFMFFGTAATAPAALMASGIAAVIGVVLGIPLGIARGHHSQVRLHDKDGHFIVDPSLVVMLIWLGAFAIRSGIKYFMPQAGEWTTGISDGLVVFAVTSVVTARIIIFRKYLALKSAPAS